MSNGAWTVSGRIRYLDGLRAYSIVTVILGHSAHLVPWMKTRVALPFAVLFTNGEFGVRVFFVLSGFLITTLLLNEHETTGRISIASFYERRIARIFPAFYTYLLMIFALVSLGQIHLQKNELVTAAAYLRNYGHLWGAVSAVGESVLGHLWSLSLEEQFYVVWPACLVILGLRWARRLALTSVLLVPFIRVATYYLVPQTRGQLMMMFHTGADQILWGTLAAFACKDGLLDRTRSFKYRGVIPWLCGFTVFVLCPLLRASVRGAGVVVAPSLECLSVVLMIFWLLSGEGGALRWSLDTWPMIQLGLLSYSIYLWQQISILWVGVSFLPLFARWVAILGVAIASYRLMEVPMRSRIRRWFSRTQAAQ